jgi:hypothetical protein
MALEGRYFFGGHVQGESSNTQGHVAKLSFNVPIKFLRQN